MCKRAFVIATVFALSISCQKFAEGKETFRELLSLRDQVAQHFHEQVVDVSTTANGRMTIKFVNSPLNAAPHEVKQKRADEVAAFVTDHYRHPLSSVATQFVSKKGPASVEETFLGASGAKP